MRCTSDAQTRGRAHTATLSPGRFRSTNDVIFLGLPGATAMASLFDAKLTGFPATRPAWVTLAMFGRSPAANTSALAPSVNCAARSDDPAKMNSTDVPGLSDLNCLPISLKLLISDDDANTVIDVVGRLCTPQPARARARTAPVANARFDRLLINLTLTTRVRGAGIRLRPVAQPHQVLTTWQNYVKSLAQRWIVA